MAEPLVSIIIPAYNCENFIKESIESIICQTYKNLEILIADDFSSDNTRKIIDHFDDLRIKRFHNNQNLGYLLTCNRLIKFATGDYIAMHDADDISDITRIEKQIEAFNDDNDLGICGVNIIFIDEKGGEVGRKSFQQNINKTIKEKQFEFVQGSFLFKKEVYLTVNFYNIYFNRIGFEDFYWTFLCSEKFKIINLNDYLYYYRKDNNNISVSTSFSDSTKNFSYISLLILIDQRIKTGADDLQLEKVRALRHKVYYKLLSLAIEKQNFNEAKKYIKPFFITNPLSFKTYRTLFYFIRKVLKKRLFAKLF